MPIFATIYKDSKQYQKPLIQDYKLPDERLKSPVLNKHPLLQLVTIFPEPIGLFKDYWNAQKIQPKALIFIFQQYQNVDYADLVLGNKALILSAESANYTEAESLF